MMPAPDDLSPLLRWIADQPDPPAVELICAAHAGAVRGHPETTVVRLDGCAAGLSVASYLEVVACGITGLTVRTDGCPAAEHVRTTVAAANRLLAGCPGGRRVACRSEATGRRRRPVYGLHRLPISRRRLLLLSQQPGPRFTPDVCAGERGRTRTALRALLGPGTGRGDAVRDLRGLPAPSANLVADGCTGCGVCVRSCPSSALVLERTGGEAGTGSFSLGFSAADCDDCGRCVALCPARALVRVGAVDWARVVEGVRLPLTTGRTRRCARCGDTYTAAGNSAEVRCPVCAFRRSRPFGLRLVDASGSASPDGAEQEAYASRPSRSGP